MTRSAVKAGGFPLSSASGPQGGTRPAAADRAPGPAAANLLKRAGVPPAPSDNQERIEAVDKSKGGTPARRCRAFWCDATATEPDGRCAMHHERALDAAAGLSWGQEP